MISLTRCLTAVGVLTLAGSVGACGGGVAAADICGAARPLKAQVANTDAATYAAHIEEWRPVIDMTKDSEDEKLAEFGELVDQKSRNSSNYYSPLNQIERAACGGKTPNPDKAG